MQEGGCRPDHWRGREGRGGEGEERGEGRGEEGGRRE